MKSELDWWIANVSTAHRKISHGSPQLLVETDTSCLGWGATCNGIKIGGTVKILLTTTQIERPPNFSDHFGPFPAIFTIICY